MKKTPYVLAVVGQTATGKSNYAVTLAKKYNGEVISIDSRQIYTGLNIGSGKITKKEMRGVPHHMLDICDPKKRYTVSQYKKKVDQIIKDCHKRGVLPILCGGTGLYIDAILSGVIFPEVPPNTQLRKKLEKLSTEELYTELQKKDPLRAESIDTKNKVRLIRALEIIESLGSVPEVKVEKPYEAYIIGITLPDEILKEKIHTRLVKRVRQGLFKEVQNLYKQGVPEKRLLELGLEYRYGMLYINKKLSKEQAISELEKSIWQYAKRQKTWFKRNTDIVWTTPDKEPKGLEKWIQKNSQ
jgi:tRNA dimethylallyltransferase